MKDGAQSDEQYMRELYERFRHGVMNNDNSEFYDENELLDIYDFAQDEGDDMVQLYVLLTGARLYPDSDFLDERKAFFLSEINPQSARKMLDRKGRRDSELWAMLKLSLDTYPDGNPEEGLIGLLTSDYNFSCEAIIRIIDLLRDLDRLDLLAENIQVIADKTDVKDVLYFEAAEALYTDERYGGIARDLADDLTRSDPFNPINWELLAKMEMALGHSSECVNAADYALAINPDSQQAKLMKALGLLPIEITHGTSRTAPEGSSSASVKTPNESDSDTFGLLGCSVKVVNDEKTTKGISADKRQKIEQAIALLKEVIKGNDDNPIAVRFLASSYQLVENNAAAAEVLRMFAESSEANIHILPDYCRIPGADPKPLYEAFARVSGRNERLWYEMTERLLKDVSADSAIDFLAYYDEKFGLRDIAEYYMSLLYRGRRFKEYIGNFTRLCEAAEKIENPFTGQAYLMLSACYLICHRFEEAYQISNTLLETMPEPDDFNLYFKQKGMMVTLSVIRNLAKNPQPFIDDPDFDPISFQFSLS